MRSDGKRACTVSAILTVAVLFVLGLVFAYPISWWWGMHGVYTSDVRKFEFHGKVVDPQERAIPNVRIGAELYTYSLFGGKSHREFTVSTDRDGRFVIGPRKGISLTLEPFEKSGYEIRGRKWPKDGWKYWVFHFSSQSYDDVAATQDTPYTFVMGETEQP